MYWFGLRGCSPWSGQKSISIIGTIKQDKGNYVPYTRWKSTDF